MKLFENFFMERVFFVGNFRFDIVSSSCDDDSSNLIIKDIKPYRFTYSGNN